LLRREPSRPATGPGKASATVKFVNPGKPDTVVHDLVKVGTGWRIADITWAARWQVGYTARALSALKRCRSFQNPHAVLL
jgi:hypothetical protein